jgi:hypothetical protein
VVEPSVRSNTGANKRKAKGESDKAQASVAAANDDDDDGNEGFRPIHQTKNKAIF